jgi:hypothetical protein
MVAGPFMAVAGLVPDAPERLAFRRTPPVGGEKQTVCAIGAAVRDSRVEWGNAPRRWSMTDIDAAALVPQLDELLDAFGKLEGQTKYHDFSDIAISVATEFVSAGVAAVGRATGEDSQYSRQLQRLIKDIPQHELHWAIPTVGGTLKAVRTALTSGYLVTVRELIHADVFGDFLEMAQHLLDEGYKDPAAVLIGGVLEGHLRKLCVRHGIPAETPDSRGNPRPKKVEAMNADLARERVYSKLDQKSVTAWYGLRTDAAHGHYESYTTEQVALMLQGVADFVTRHPA